MRKFLNAWLRRWAEASLRNELNGAQENLFRALRTRDNLLEVIEQNKKSSAALIEKHKKQRALDCAIVSALRERVPLSLFDGVVAHCKNKAKGLTE